MMNKKDFTQKPSIRWSLGTSYDLFASLHVLHHPERFGLRPAWAAGVRSRLSVPQRSILEDSQTLFFNSPIAWIASLPEPKSASAAVSFLARVKPTELLPFLSYHSDLPSTVLSMLNEIRSTESWTQNELEHLQLYFKQKNDLISPDKLVTILKWWASSAEFGERYVEALQAYMEVFFAEEERRISPYLQQALENARLKAADLNFPNLMLELSQGVKIAAFEEADLVTFAPSYWITPLVMYDSVEPQKWTVLFGARPAEVALVPGEVVPDAMLRALKALSDPTRLLILHYLHDQPATPSQLARKLRLRAPTVVHHLNALRLAGLVYISLEFEGEKRYSARSAALAETFENLDRFIHEPGEK
jgi:DNA-binding transcriptional ArsR family regulator